ncbi:MAG: hypothetical protein GX582_03305 [Acholeplasmataceae bacterium]|nr:hypothetical protein [Acholeplasmataceae bacterium]
MATYKSGFKKQSAEQMLLKVIIGIIIAVFAIVLVAFIYDIATKNRYYSDYTHITKYAEIMTQTDESIQIEDYIVYFYSGSCTACESIQKKALREMAGIVKDGGKVFMVNTDNMTDREPKKAEFEDVIEENLLVPSVVVVQDGEYYEYVSSTTAVLELLESINDGAYEPFNE